MSLSKEAITFFKGITDPILGQSYLDLGWVRHRDGMIHLRLGYPQRDEACKALQAELQARMKDAGITESLSVSWKVARHKVQPNLQPKPGISNIIAVGSGKGGVGKSTVAANLACALTVLGAKVGILDADIYGPSQPHIFGIKEKPEVHENKFIPLTSHGVAMLSMGSLVEEDNAMIWRGPMVSGALLQLFEQSLWPDLDYLILDLPPGTGDIQLTMAQKLPITGAVVVTTPQDLSLLDAKKAISMFQKVEIPVLGVLENMSTHVCEACGHESALFGEKGGERLASHFKVPFLGDIPLAKPIGEHTELGSPTVIQDPQSAHAQRYLDIALQVAASIAARLKDLQVAMNVAVAT